VTIVTITKQIMMITVLKTAQVTLIFVGSGSYSMGGAPALHKQLR